MENIETKSRRDYEEPYVGMPIRGIRDYGCYQCPKPKYTMPGYTCPDDVLSEYGESGSACDAVDVCRVGMTYTPMQRWRDIYEPEKALSRGTIFAELDMPFLGGGGR